MRGHPCRQLGRARRPVPTNDPGPPLKGAECSAPRRCGRRRDSARRGRGRRREGTRTRYAGRNDALPHRHGPQVRARRSEPAPPWSPRAPRRSTARARPSRTLPRPQTASRTGDVPSMKATSFSSVSVVERASLCEYSMGHPSSWLVALRDSIGLCPVSPVLPIAPAATLPSRRVPCREPIPRVAAWSPLLSSPGPWRPTLCPRQSVIWRTQTSHKSNKFR